MQSPSSVIGSPSPQADCKPFTPAPRTPFAACAGEPFGTWRLTGYEAETGTLTIKAATFGTSRAGALCPMNIIESGTPEVILELLDGGSGRMYQTSTNYRFEHSDQCALGASNARCENRLGNDTCTQSCDTCTCNSHTLALDSRIAWERADSQLTVVHLQTAELERSFDYCVSGDELRLSELGAAVMTLERVFPVSNPTACASRTLETCQLGQDPGKGCHTGLCAGAGTCDLAVTEETCTNSKGCTWDPTVCAGDSGGFCELRQMGKTPGCELGKAEQRCTGTRTPCEDLDADTCAAAEGCFFGTGCAGGSVNCSALSGACGLCENVDGCSVCPSSQSTCGGTSSCSAQTNQYACELVAEYEMGSCEWVDAVCRGTPTACTELSVDQCEDGPGCHLEPAAP